MKDRRQFIVFPYVPAFEYIQFKAWERSNRNSSVFEFGFSEKKYNKIEPAEKLVDIPKDINFIQLCEPERNPSIYRKKCESRISDIFTRSFDEICQITISPPGEKPIKVQGLCKHFVNYLAFGMIRQEGVFPKNWYEELPFTQILDFDSNELKWGDIVELSDDGRSKHFVSTQKPVHEEAKPEFVVYPSNP